MNLKFLRLSVVFAAVYFFSLNGLASLPNISLGFLLKDRIKLGPAEMAYFQALTLLAWVIKPLWGFISDSFPIRGLKRKPYLILTSAAALIGWLGLAQSQTITIQLLLAMISLAYFAYAFQDVVTDGLMIDEGKPSNFLGQFQSIQWCSVYAATILTALGGGLISSLIQKGNISYQQMFLITAAFPLVTLALSICLVQENPNPEAETRKIEWRNLWMSREAWIIAAFLFLWNFSPSFGAPFFFYAVDTLKFTGDFLGVLQATASVGSLIGSLLFGIWFSKIGIRKFLIAAVAAGILAIASHALYFIPSLISNTFAIRTIALILNFIFGLLNAAIMLQLMSIAARVCPDKAGATTFAFLMSFYNLGQMGSSALGGFLFPFLGLRWLIVISAFFSLLVLPLIPILPLSKNGTCRD